MDTRWLAALLVATGGCVVAVDDDFCVDEPVVGVVLDIDNGDVVVEPGDRLCVSVELGGVGSGGVGHRVEREVLFLDYACSGLCGGEITVTAPADLLLDVELGAGDLQLDGRRGEVLARLGAGELSAHDLEAERAELAVGTGDLNASWRTRPLDVVALTAAGAVDLEVPAGAYALTVSADGGAVALEGVYDDPGAEAAIQAETGAGSVRIRGR